MTAYTYDDPAIREDLLDILTNLTPTDTQLVTGLGQSTADATLHQWLIDTLAGPAYNAFAEGADACLRTLTNPVRLTNDTQILKKGFQVTGSERAAKQASFSDRFSYETTKAMKELKNDLEFAVVRGTLVASVVSSDSQRSMRGIRASLSLVTSQSGVSLTELILNDLFQLVWDNGTEVNELYGSMYIKRKISAFTAGTTKFTKVEDRRLINAVDVYEADAARLVKLFAHRHVTVSGDTNYDVIGIDAERFKIAYYRKPFINPIATTGDATKSELITEATLETLHYNAGFYSQKHL